MSAPVATTVARMTRDDAKILAHYSQGESARQIANGLDMELEDVGMVLDSLAGNNREIALELVTAWQKRVNAVAAARPVSGSPAPRPAAPKPITNVVLESVRQPADQPVEENIDGVADMLDAAEASESPKLERAAKKIRDLLAVLQEDLAEHSREARLRREQAELEARLAEVKKQLRPQRQATPVSPAPANVPAVDSKAIRAWAAENDITCPPVGRVPGDVVTAYRRAVAA